MESRIKDIKLAAQIDEGILAWHQHITPLTEHYAKLVSQRDLQREKAGLLGAYYLAERCSHVPRLATVRGRDRGWGV